MVNPAEASAMKPFSYSSPENSENQPPKFLVRLASAPGIHAAVQVVKQGGENNLHSHPQTDGFWFVLSGRCRFYSDTDTVLGEYGMHEGVLVPHGAQYWFESVGDERLELLHVASAVAEGVDMLADRVNFTEATPAMRTASVLEGT